MISLFIISGKLFVQGGGGTHKGPRIKPYRKLFFISSHLEDLLLSVTLPSVTFS